MARDDPLTARVSASILHSRRNGVPVLGGVLGVHAVAHERADRGAKPLALAPPDERISTMELAMLADFALGGVLRSVTGPDHPLPTVTLDLQLTAEARRASQLVVWPASRVAVADGTGSATASIEKAGAVVGQCSALFSLSPAAVRVGSLPWEVETVAEEAENDKEELTTDEGGLVRLISRIAGAADSPSWSEVLIEELFTPPSAAEPLWRATPKAYMTNRGGFLQGGILFAMAAHAALAGGGAALRLASGHIEFVSSGIPDVELTVTVEALHETRRTVFRRALVHQQGRLVANASFVARHR